MCGIAGAIDLTGTREFSRAALAGDDRRDRSSRSRRRAVPHRAGRGAGGPAAVDHRPGGRPAADRQRGRLGLGRLQRRAVRVPRAAPASSWRAAIAWRPAATPRRGSTSTRTSARRCSRRPAASSPSRSGTATTRTLILGRDRVGICPLYYAEVDGWLLWGSEIKALLASGMVAARPDPRGIDHLFTFFCAGTTRTFFEGIKSLPPGHFLKVRDGRVEPSTSTGTSTSPTPATSAGWTTRRRWSTSSRRLLQQAVERRLRSDVPVVSYISGGLDSTVVLGLLQPAPRRADPVVHDRARQGRARRAVARRPRRRAVLGSPLTTVDDGSRGASPTPFPS